MIIMIMNYILFALAHHAYLDNYSVSSLKQQSAGRHDRYFFLTYDIIILVISTFFLTLDPYYCVVSGKAENNIFSIPIVY